MKMIVRQLELEILKNIKDQNDTGTLWENFMITERMKRNA